MRVQRLFWPWGKGLAAIAAECGDFGQGQLAEDFQRVSGGSPKPLLRNTTDDEEYRVRVAMS